MGIQSSDTPPEVERVQIDLLRRAGPARRFALARSLSQTVMQLARGGIRRRHPDANEEEVGLIFIATHYGRELAEQVRVDLARRQRR
ncbi:MAG: hypothetical protein IT340_07895 [Chloroflexi bacterium]|nr:hypothetical protein [Chloroflexota bacterium]